MEKGLVIKSTGSWYQVKTEAGAIVPCKIRGKFRSMGIRTTNPIAVGDRVQFTLEKKSEHGVITSIEPRKNYIIRRSINLSKQSHILAANIDQALLMVTLVKPRTYPEFIDRFLVSAEAYTIPAKIIFNKTDLYDSAALDEMQSLKNLYEKIGYPCFIISAKEKTGIDTISDLLKDRISLISGHSGVGKSTLINAIDPGLNLKTTEISQYHDSGKHTTTFPEMHALVTGGYIIDTPGIKGFGVVDMDKEELSHYFPEIFTLSTQCQYYNCSHSHEPNCAVKIGVQDGLISESRYRSYISLLVGDEDEKYRSNAY